MKLYYSNQRQAAQNKYYPHMREINNVDDLAAVAAYDHVAASFKDNCRGNANFIHSDCSMFDVDNTHSDDPMDWVTPADVQETFPNVGFYVCYSRNHMKAKGQTHLVQSFTCISWMLYLTVQKNMLLTSKWSALISLPLILMLRMLPGFSLAWRNPWWNSMPVMFCCLT